MDSNVSYVILQKGQRKKIFDHKSISDFLSSLTSSITEEKFFEVKVDDLELEKPFALDTLRLSVLSAERCDDSGKKLKFTANGFYNNPGFEESEEWKSCGVLKGVINF